MRLDPNKAPPALQRLKVFLWKPGAGAPTAQPCYTDLVTAGAIRIRLPEGLLGRGFLRRVKNLQALQQRFAKRLGSEFELQIRDGVRPVWRGTVRVAGMEMPSGNPPSLAVTLAFREPLSDDDLLALGLLETPQTSVGSAPHHEERPVPALPVTAPRAAPAEEHPLPTDAESRRQAPRLAIDIPVALHTAQGECAAKVKDLSRTGIRFHVRAKDLGFAPTRELEAIAVGVGAVLQQSFHVDLNHELLGSLLRKFVHMTRLSVARESAALVEICGRFERPLQLEEATMLGIPLPPSKDSGESWNPEEGMVEPTIRDPVLPMPPPRLIGSARNPESESKEPAAEEDAVDPALPSGLGFTVSRRVRAQVRAPRGGKGQTVLCQTDLIGYDGIRLRMPRSSLIGHAGGPIAGVAEAVTRFRKVFGELPNTKLVDGAEHLWTGAARLAAIDLLPDAPEEIWVTLVYVQALRPAEIRRLGLPALVA